MELVLGAAQFGLPYGVTNYTGKQPSYNNFVSILDYAYDHNITTLDTAETYGDANLRISTFHHASSKRFKIINKILREPVYEPRQLVELKSKLRNELNKMDIPCFDVIMLHYAPSITDLVRQDFFFDLIKAGITKKIGVSVNNRNEYALIQNKFLWDVVQIPSNILNQNIIDQDFFKILKENNCEIHVRSIYLQGLLLADTNLIPKHLIRLAPFVLKIQNLAKKLDVSVQTLCMIFVMSNKFIDKIVFGVQSKNELASILESYQNAKNFSEKNIHIDWTEFGCSDPALVDPTQWSKLEALNDSNR